MPKLRSDSCFYVFTIIVIFLYLVRWRELAVDEEADEEDCVSGYLLRRKDLSG